MDEQTLLSIIECPHCGSRKQEQMPTDACLFFYECAGCARMLRPLRGDCCVFCSYGSVKCPPVQLQKGCCAKPATAGQALVQNFSPPTGATSPFNE